MQRDYKNKALDTTRHEGQLVRWTQSKFGFLRFGSPPEEIFVHVSALPGERAVPIGTRMTFEIGADPRGRKRAVNVQILG